MKKPFSFLMMRSSSLSFFFRLQAFLVFLSSSLALGSYDGRKCARLTSRYPTFTAAERLSYVSQSICADMRFTNLAPLLKQFASENKFQESIWLLNQFGYRPLADALELNLRCYLHEGLVVNSSPLGGGATTTKLITFENGLQAVYKPYEYNLSANVGSEVGTYIIDRLLMLDIVPVTIKRSLDVFSDEGSLQYFVKGSYLAAKLPPQQQRKAPEMLLLDYFIKNIDRHNGNYLYHPLLNKMIAIDNGWGLRGRNFFALIKSCFVDKRDCNEKRITFTYETLPSLSLYHRFCSLPEKTLEGALKGIVSRGGISKLVKRKKKVLHALEKAFDMYGIDRGLRSIGLAAGVR